MDEEKDNKKKKRKRKSKKSKKDKKDKKDKKVRKRKKKGRDNFVSLNLKKKYKERYRGTLRFLKKHRKGNRR